MNFTIRKINEVKLVRYKASSIDHYDNVDIEAHAFIPGCCITGNGNFRMSFKTKNGTEEKIVFRNDQRSDFNAILRSKDLAISTIANKDLLDLLGDFFFAKLTENKSNCNVYNYKIAKPDDRLFIPNLQYYRHKECDYQYLMLFAEMDERERSQDQHGIYIHCLWQVEFDHDEFMRLINETVL